MPSLRSSVVLLLAGISLIHCGDNVISGVNQAEDGSSGTISFKTPELDDEDAHSLHMPSSLKCDACRIIAYLIYTNFDDIHNNRPSLKNKNLPESDILDVMEYVCKPKNFEHYGVKDVKGVKRLSGPGLETSDTPGIMQGGGKWPGRLYQMCGAYMGELGEEEIYAEYKTLGKDLETYLCYGKGIQGECSDLNKTKKRKAKKSKQEL